MLNWLSSTSKGKESSSNGSNTTGNAVIYVDDKDPEITAEPIFDEEPALYIVFPHANNPGSQAPKVRMPHQIYASHLEHYPDYGVYICNLLITDPIYHCDDAGHQDHREILDDTQETK